MSAFYPSTSAGGQLSLLQDMAADHCATHSTSVFGDGLRAPPNDPAAERHAGSLTASRTGFPANFLSYAGGGDFRDFCSPPTAVDASVAAKVSPTGSTINSRRCSRGDECKDDFGGGGGGGAAPGDRPLTSSATPAWSTGDVADVVGLWWRYHCRACCMNSSS